MLWFAYIMFSNCSVDIQTIVIMNEKYSECEERTELSEIGQVLDRLGEKGEGSCLLRRWVV